MPGRQVDDREDLLAPRDALVELGDTGEVLRGLEAGREPGDVGEQALGLDAPTDLKLRPRPK